MADYITTADITDALLSETGLSARLAAKIVLSTLEVNDLAERKGVDSGDIPLTTPVHLLVKKYAVAWTCMSLCEDLIGKNKTDGGVESDIYNQKAKIYRQKLQEAEGEITYEVLTGDSEDSQRVGPRTGSILLAG